MESAVAIHSTAVPAPALGDARHRAWPASARFGFRLLFSYLVLYLLPFPLDMIPGLGRVGEAWAAVWQALVPEVGRRAFALDITVLPNGSGDTTFNYVQTLCFAALAVVSAGLWTALDRRRSSYAVLHRWLRGYVRLALGFTMVSYGAFKVIQSQFPPPTLDRLLQPIGDASPMGLLWTFMGASLAYNVFTGLGEVAGGLLLATRRTTLLGSLVCIGVLANVVMLNFSYDVPVKLFSTHLLAMAVFLAAPDARRLARFFVLNAPVEPAVLVPLLPRATPHRVALALRTVAFAAAAVLFLFQSHQQRSQFQSSLGQGPLAGLWDVVGEAVDGAPAASPGSRGWRRLVFSSSSLVAVHAEDGSRERYRYELQPLARRLVMSKRDDPSWTSTLEFRRLGPGEIELSGAFDGRAVRTRLRRVEEPVFRLTSRGFHWISEYPFNR
jgi:hypothetical protein